MTAGAPPGESLRSTGSARIAYVVTHPMTVEYLLRGQLAFLVSQGFEVYVLAGPGARLDDVDARAGASYVPIRGLSREIRLLSDLVALFQIFKTLRRLRPDIVNASTPKAGLLGMLAGFFARAPHRIYTLRGLRLETTRGFEQGILTITEKIAAACAHRVVAVSSTLRERALTLGLVAANRIEVLGGGSSNGVDTTRFHGKLMPTDVRLRDDLGLSQDAPVVGFVGRLTRDKGIRDLVVAFTEQVRPRIPTARLLLVGGFESGDTIDATMQRDLAQNPAVVLVGFVEDSAPYYRLMDVLAFPSYREGFPNAPLEAAASKVPVAGYAATGTVDAVIEGTTGTLVPAGNVSALGEALCKYLFDPDLRRRHGEAGRSRVLEQFRSEIVWEEWKRLYVREVTLATARKGDSWYARRGKRLLDLVLASFLLILLLPVFALLSLVALVADGWPIFFHQQRPGKAGKPFVLTKYRTMRPQREPASEDDALRLTRFGRFLRRTSLDELPELWCVLRGDMGLVGPRPLLMEYLGLYTPEQSRRHSVRPGLTGWAQIRGRNVLSWEEKFEHDLWYVDHCSLFLDLKILLITFSKVLRGDGISAPKHATMPRFRGSKK